MTVPSPVIVRASEGQIEHWPQGCEALHGWTAAEALGRISHELLHTRFPQPLADIEAALRRDGEWTGELQQVTRGGETRWIAARWVLQDRGAEAPARVVEGLNDISELKRAETTVRDSQDRLAQAVATYELGIIDYDPRTREALFSPELERIAGVSAGGLGADLQQWYALLLSEDRERVLREMADDIARQAPQRRYAFKIQRRDGEIRELSAVRRCVYADDGACRRKISIFMDVTEQVRDRAELEARGARLMELQSELTHVSRLSAMGEMAAALAHELNQPLSAVGNSIGVIGMILRRPAEAMDAAARQRVARAVQMAEEQILRAGEIVRRLREFIARGEADSQVENLRDLIEDAVALALPNPDAAGVACRRAFSPGVTQVLADRIQIQQVLVNLIRNAIEAMRGQDPPRILTLTTRAEAGMAVMGVADSGPGVAPNVAAGLFSPFMSTKTDGMGVGLSICRRIVEAHSGTMWLEPGNPGGADFRFTLRLISPEAPDGEF